VNMIMILLFSFFLDDWRDRRDPASIQALDVALSAFAKWQVGEHDPKWIIAGNKVFRYFSYFHLLFESLFYFILFRLFIFFLRAEGTSYDFSAAYLGRLGYYFSLKACMAGLVLMTEVSVNCFLKGGKFVELMSAIGGFRSVDDMCRQVYNDAFGLPRAVLDRIENTLKGCKIRLTHLGHRKVFKKFGPPSNHHESGFTTEDGSTMTVAQYYELQARTNEAYANALIGGRLKYPQLPTINAGTKKRQILIPVELVEVIPGKHFPIFFSFSLFLIVSLMRCSFCFLLSLFLLLGQSKNQGLPGDVASSIIKYAAMVPNDRFRHIDSESRRNGLLYELQHDKTAVAFGFDNVHTTPMKVQGFILPPPKLQYKSRVVEPELKGSWNLSGGVSFAIPPPLPEGSTGRIDKYYYGE
jgi:hypothetical protein